MGLVNFPDESFDDGMDILWVGDRLRPEVYGHDPSDGYGTGENEEIYWHYDHDGWHGFVPDGQGCWLETDGYGTYWSTEDALWKKNFHLRSTKSWMRLLRLMGQRHEPSRKVVNSNEPKGRAEASTPSKD